MGRAAPDGVERDGGTRTVARIRGAPGPEDAPAAHSGGDGTEQDLAEALAWFLRAAETGFVPALLNVAECHRQGEGVPRDGGEAARWYRRALETEQCVSAFALGELHEAGDGVERSLDEAERYFLLARANRHPEAYRALKRIGRTPPD